MSFLTRREFCKRVFGLPPALLAAEMVRRGIIKDEPTSTIKVRVHPFVADAVEANPVKAHAAIRRSVIELQNILEKGQSVGGITPATWKWDRA